MESPSHQCCRRSRRAGGHRFPGWCRGRAWSHKLWRGAQCCSRGEAVRGIAAVETAKGGGQNEEKMNICAQTTSQVRVKSSLNCAAVSEQNNFYFFFRKVFRRPDPTSHSKVIIITWRLEAELGRAALSLVVPYPKKKRQSKTVQYVCPNTRCQSCIEETRAGSYQYRGMPCERCTLSRHGRHHPKCLIGLPPNTDSSVRRGSNPSASFFFRADRNLIPGDKGGAAVTTTEWCEGSGKCEERDAPNANNQDNEG